MSEKILDIPLHPAVVHLPIGLLFTTTLFAIISLFTHTNTLKKVNYWILSTGVLFVMLAIGTGLFESENLVHDQEIHELLEKHEMNAFIASGLYTTLLIWQIFRAGINNKTEYYCWVFLSVIALGFLLWQGHLGGKMVFEHGAGVEPMKEILIKEGNGNH